MSKHYLRTLRKSQNVLLPYLTEKLLLDTLNFIAFSLSEGIFHRQSTFNISSLPEVWGTYIEIWLFLCCSAIGLQIRYTNDKQINKNLLKLNFFFLADGEGIAELHVCRLEDF